MKFHHNIIAIISVLLTAFFCACEQSGKEASAFDTRARIDYRTLKEGFHHVPREARMRTWWFWMNGTATKRSITQDLEAMKANGIAGAILIDNGGDYAPLGPAFMSVEWKDLFAHVIKEADRLGMEISLNIQSGAGDPGNPNIEDDNGLKKITWSEQKVKGPRHIEMDLEMPAHQIFYTDITIQAFKSPHTELRRDELIRNWGVKTFSTKERWNQDMDRYDLKQFYEYHESPGQVPAIPEDGIRDLSSHFKDGKITWDVPAGEWTIIRYGYTSTGKRNNYASKDYRGGLCYDPIHKRGINAQWRDVVLPLIHIARAKGNSLKYVHVDSWEMKTTNWTHDFELGFKQLRDYDIHPFLPVLAGYIVGSRDISNRFLEDFRLTVGDMAAEYNYGELRKLAHSEGISMHSESAGPHLPPVDGLKTLGINDIPMGESWARAKTHRNTEAKRLNVKLGASAAHIYGKRFFAAEIPTSVGPVWERSPADVKIVLDRGFCTGVNRVNWHTYTSSPDEYGLPGIEYFAGTHLNRHVTWWKESKVFIDYINRTQHMLSQGIHVADVLGYLGSGVPLFGFLDGDRGDIPEGYAWDMCNAEVVLDRAQVMDGQICLPDGKEYSILALSNHRDLSLPVLRKIELMVKQGMVLVGSPPERASGLSGYPGSDQELKDIVKRLWGKAEGVNSFMNEYGKGRVYAGRTVARVLEMEKTGPDLYWEPGQDIDLEYIHRTSDEVDIYYVLNKWAWKGIRDLEHRNSPALPDNFVQVECSFRVEGDRTIEQWDPVSGVITPVHVFEQNEGYYTLPVSLEPEGAAFYVFRKAEKADHIRKIEKDGRELTEGNTPLARGASDLFAGKQALEVFEGGEYRLSEAGGRECTIMVDDIPDDREIPGPWKVTFQEKPSLGELFTATFDTLKSWTGSEKHAIKYYSGTALYEKRFTLEKQCISGGRTYLDLGKVGDIATLTLNGSEVGTFWKPPYIADITDFVKEGENTLEVSVCNLWINRLIGDEKLPREERKTSTNLVNDRGRYEKLSQPDADQHLRVSGLIGPVKIRFSRIYEY
ncbi:MAG: glycoside hydrolase family 2 [Bacteroidetes bacterium]|nr:glycoside hydrolase family 2 [Bacteroidota bacterium]